MKRLLLAAAVFAAVPLGKPAAQLAVIDPAHIAANGANWAQQVRDMLAQLRELRRHYVMLEGTYNSLSGARDVSGVASALGGVTRQWVPEASEALSMIGSAGRLFGNAGGIMTADRLYQAERLSGSFAQMDEVWHAMHERALIVTANAKAFAEEGLRDLQGRTLELASAQARLSAARDVNDVNAVQGLLQAQAMNVAMHGQKLQTFALTLASEDRVERQRGEQRARMSAEEGIRDTQWAADSLGAFGGGPLAAADANSGW